MGWLDTLPPSIMNYAEAFQGDIRDSHGVKEAMKGCSSVFYLVALIANLAIIYRMLMWLPTLKAH